MTSAYWLKLQADYEYNERMLSLRDEELRQADSKESVLREVFNIKDLYAYLGIIAVSPVARTKELYRLLDTTYEGLLERTAIVGCFKHSDKLPINEANLRTWVLMAQYAARQETPEAEFDEEKAEYAASEIARQANMGTLKETDIKNILSAAGIAYVIVDYKLKGCPVDGYSCKIGNIPSIVVTHRHNNMQKLIFDILHEIGHIVKHMGNVNKDFLNIEYSQGNQQESEANEFAQNHLISPSTWTKILQIRLNNLRHDLVCRKIGDRAKELGIDPHIAVARYKHDSNQYSGKAYATTKIV